MSDGLEVVAWHRASHHAQVLAGLRERLAASGAITELRILEGMSAQELDVLVTREVSA